jgi:hypothetical protein
LKITYKIIKELYISLIIIVAIIILQPLNSFPQPNRCANTILCNSNSPSNSQYLTPLTVKFLSINIINDHDGGLFNDGEIFLNANVNGKNIQLLNSYEDLGSGDTFQFNNKIVHVNLFPGENLIIRTSGCESDGDQTKGCTVAHDEIGEIYASYNYPGYSSGSPIIQTSSFNDFKLTFVICNPLSKIDSPYC